MSRVFQSLRRKVSNTESSGNNEQNGNFQGSRGKQDAKSNASRDSSVLNPHKGSEDSESQSSLRFNDVLSQDSETGTQYSNDGSAFFQNDIEAVAQRDCKHQNDDHVFLNHIEVNKADPETGIVNVSFPPVEFIKTEKFSFLCEFIKDGSESEAINGVLSDNENDFRTKVGAEACIDKDGTRDCFEGGRHGESGAGSKECNGYRGDFNNTHLSNTFLPLPNGLLEIPNGLVLIRDPFSSLPSLQKAKTNEDALDLIKKKLISCCIVFNFSSGVFSNLKEKKRETLLELVEYINNNDQVFQEDMIPHILLMITSNIFRSFSQVQVTNSNVSVSSGNAANGGTHASGVATTTRKNAVNTSNGLLSSTIVDAKDDEQLLEPSWPHLLVVYEFFLRFVISSQFGTKIAKKYIDNSLILKLIDLFQSFDPRERDYLKTILHRIYGKIMPRRSCIRKAMKYIFLRVIIDGEPYNGIAELLEIFVSIVNGFTIPLKEEHKLFLETALIPLHKAKHISSFHQQLIYCLIQYIEKDTKLSVPIIEGVLKYWPITNSSKQILFLNELEELLEITPTNYIEPILMPIFERLAACIQSPHFHVAERVLYLWNNEVIVNLVNEYKYDIYPVLIKALSYNGKKLHWNPTVHGLSFVVNKVLSETDPDLFSQILQQNNSDNANIEIQKKKREEYWKYIIDLAESMDS